VTSSERKRRDAKGQTFPEDFCNYAPAVWPRTTVQWYRVRRAPNLKGMESQYTQILGIPTYAHAAWPMGSDQIWYGNTCGEEHVSMGQPLPQVREGVGPSVPRRFWGSYTVWETAIIFCMVIKLDQENFTRSTTPPALAKNFGDTNADARSVCGS